MALIICKDCKKEFSTDTKSCPHCGAKKPPTMFDQIWLVFTAFIVVLVMYFLIPKESTHSAYNNQGSKTSAYTKAPEYPQYLKNIATLTGQDIERLVAFERAVIASGGNEGDVSFTYQAMFNQYAGMRLRLMDIDNLFKSWRSNIKSLDSASLKQQFFEKHGITPDGIKILLLKPDWEYDLLTGNNNQKQNTDNNIESTNPDIKQVQNDEVETRNYPEQLQKIIVATDWPHVRSALIAANRLKAEATLVKWANKKNGHSGNVILTGSQPDPEGCVQFRIDRGEMSDSDMSAYVDVCEGGIIK